MQHHYRFSFKKRSWILMTFFNFRRLLTLRKLCDKFLYVASRTCQKITNSLYYLQQAKFKDNLINSKQNEFAQIRDCDLGGFGKLKKIWQQKHSIDPNCT